MNKSTYLNKQLIFLNLSPDGVPLGGGGPTNLPQKEPELPPDAIVGDEAAAKVQAQPDSTPAQTQQTTSTERPVHEVGKQMEDDKEDAEPTSIEDFLKVTDSKQVKAVPVVEKKDDPKAPKVEPTQDAKETPTARNYDDIDEADREFFKKMGNGSFAKLKPIYLEHKKQQAEIAKYKEDLAKAKEGSLPDSYFEHPEAYQFDKGFQEASTGYNTVTQIANHWKQQLMNMEEGKDYQELMFNADKTGFVLGEKKPANAQNKIAALELYQKALATQEHFRKQGEEIRSNFTTTHKQHIEGLKETEKNWFPSMNDEKAEPTIFAKQLHEKFPPFIQRNPVSMLLAKATASVILMNKELTELKAKLAAGGGGTQVNGNGKVAAAPAKRQNPNMSDMGVSSAAPKNGEEEDVSYEDFLKLRERSF